VYLGDNILKGGIIRHETLRKKRRKKCICMGVKAKGLAEGLRLHLLAGNGAVKKRSGDSRRRDFKKR